jgi:hypothetical protein
MAKQTQAVDKSEFEIEMENSFFCNFDLIPGAEFRLEEFILILIALKKKKIKNEVLKNIPVQLI